VAGYDSGCTEPALTRVSVRRRRPQGEQHCDILAVEFALLQLAVEDAEQTAGGRCARRVSAGCRRPARHRGGRRGFAETSRVQIESVWAAFLGVVEEVVHVAADGAGGAEAGGDLGVWGEAARTAAAELDLAAMSRSRSMRCLPRVCADRAAIGDRDAICAASVVRVRWWSSCSS